MERVSLRLKFNMDDGKAMSISFADCDPQITKEVAKNLGENIASAKMFKKKEQVIEEFAQAIKVSVKEEILV